MMVGFSLWGAGRGNWISNTGPYTSATIMNFNKMYYFNSKNIDGTITCNLTVLGECKMFLLG